MNAGRTQKGFAYLGVLLTVAATGAVLASVGELASRSAQREKEAQLLFAGKQIRSAIGSYYERSPGGDKRYPKRLEDLLLDERYPVLQRHLRRVYPDPLSGKAEWGLVKTPEGGIMGVHSLSEEAPIKSGNFARTEEPFAEAKRYADWQFIYAPVVIPGAGQ